MYINADKFTPADAKYIPTGEIKEVTGTPMDFRKAHAIRNGGHHRPGAARPLVFKR